MKAIANIFVSLLIAGCGVNQSSQYESRLEGLKSIVKPGDNIYTTQKMLKSKGIDVSDVHDPTGLGKNLSIHVHFGLSAGVIDGVKYASGVPDEGSISALIEADGSGKIVSIR